MTTHLRYTSAQLRSVGMTLITAHSGCEGTAPNSIDHILAAIDSGAEMIEVDIRAHGDLLYLSHDVAEDPAACVSFETFLELISPVPDLRVNCDVKTDGLITPVMEAARRFGVAHRMAFTGACNHQNDLIVAQGGSLWPSLWPCGDNETAVKRACDTFQGVGEPILNLHYSMISESGLTYLRDRGMDFSAWTVDDEATLRALLEMGITNITTRKPVLALRLRDEIQGTPASRGLLPLERMEALIREAGAIMRSVPDEVRNNPECKEGSANFVTAYDVKVQEFLKEGLTRLFPDAIFCMDTALRYYGYSDRTPGDWHLAVSKDSGKSRFNIDYPFVKPYYVEPAVLELGLTKGNMDGHEIRIYDKDRVICDCLRYRNKMDKEIFNKAIQNYIADPEKSIPKLLEYAEPLRVKKIAKDLIGVWL